MTREKRETPIIRNRKATFNYEILETYEAGLVLQGCEVKSLREGEGSLAESYGMAKEGEVYLYNFRISPYKAGSWTNPDPLRPKKLLLRKPEIRRLIGRVSEKGLTLVPLSVYFKRGYAKVKLGLGKGKRFFDKRHAIKEREAKREMGRALRTRARPR